MELTSNKPYLLRAIYEWVMDNDATPHILISALNPSVDVPQQFVEDGKIILNVSPSAANNLLIDDEGVSFSARFGGKPFNIYSPIGSVLALYASENGEGMAFEAEDFDDLPPDDPEAENPDSSNVTSLQKASKKSKKRPVLKVVK